MHLSPRVQSHLVVQDGGFNLHGSPAETAGALEPGARVLGFGPLLLPYGIGLLHQRFGLCSVRRGIADALNSNDHVRLQPGGQPVGVHKGRLRPSLSCDAVPSRREAARAAGG